ncbi:hypothetical protein ACLB2K_056336 [Fragaria x ananassa]
MVTTHWDGSAERYLRSQRIPPLEYIPTVTSHFRPDACMWMNSFEERNPWATWEQFSSAILEHYGASSITDIQIVLACLEQTTTVDAFIVAFTKLSSRAYGWTKAQLLPNFLGGLKPEICHDVQVMEPRTLAEAQRLARRLEAKLNDSRLHRLSRPSGAWSSSSKQNTIGSQNSSIN